jgi:hypothetical protein
LALPLLSPEVFHDLDPDFSAIIVVRIRHAARIDADEFDLRSHGYANTSSSGVTEMDSCETLYLCGALPGLLRLYPPDGTVYQSGWNGSS